MSNPLVPPIRGVLDIMPYRPGAAKAPNTERPIRLASNEAALGPSPLALAALEAAARGTSDRYPDPMSTALRHAISSRYGQAFDRIVCAGGSEPLIHIIVRAYAGVGDKVVLPATTFASYPIAIRAAGAQPKFVREQAGYRIEVDDILSAIGADTRIVVLANPNNPTGAIVAADEVRRLRQGMPDNVLLVLDAAYRDYVDSPEYSTGDELVDDAHANVVVLSTFSKAYALAGARVGWAYAGCEIIEVINRVRPVFNVASASQAAAIAALCDVDHLASELALVREVRPRFVEALQAMGLAVGPATANFVLVDLPAERGTGPALFDYLAQQGILIRPLMNYAMPQSVRITIGRAEEMDAVADALRRWAST